MCTFIVVNSRATGTTTEEYIGGNVSLTGNDQGTVAAALSDGKAPSRISIVKVRMSSGTNTKFWRRSTWVTDSITWFTASLSPSSTYFTVAQYPCETNGTYGAEDYSTDRATNT